MDFKSLRKHQKLNVAVIFCTALVILSVVGKIIFAEDNTMSSGTASYTSTSSTSTSTSADGTIGSSGTTASTDPSLASSGGTTATTTQTLTQSGDIQTTTTIINPIPLAPTNLLKYETPNMASITIYWNDNSNNEEKFRIDRKNSNNTNWSTIGYSSNASYTDTTAWPGYLYDYRVQACSGAGCSPYALLERVSFSTASPSTIDSSMVSTNTTPTSTTTTTNTVTTNQEGVTSSADTASSTTLQTTTSDTETSKTATETPKESYSTTTEKPVIKDDSKLTSSTTNTSSFTTTQNTETSLLQKTVTSTGDVNEREADKFADSKINEDPILDSSNVDILAVTNTLNEFTKVVDKQSDEQTAPDIELVYKDSNLDGITDYDSLYVYNIDPVSTPIVSSYEGRNITPEEKILLGFDPSSSDLVKVNIEQPLFTEAPVVTTYKVKEVAFTPQKEIFIKGTALPNSFVTLYIYSTPIIVTVKTDKNGEWQYTLDRELEDGEHTVYTATVNNTGNIVAKSSGYLFVKTAEAVTLNDIPLPDSSNSSKPSLFDSGFIMLLAYGIGTLVIIVLVVIGFTKRNKEQPGTDATLGQ